MLVCALVHEGTTSLSLARIHIVEEQLAPFPDDIRIQPCRQCMDPLCLRACPTGALHVDTQRGNVRTIDEDICDGCRACYEAWPYDPKRIMWHHEKQIAIKCDLCIHTPHWTEEGGPAGKQACITVCPANAIAFTGEAPDQEGTTGYEVDLRTEAPNPAKLKLY